MNAALANKTFIYTRKHLKVHSELIFCFKMYPIWHRQYMLNSNFLYVPPTLSLISVSLAAYNRDKLLGLSWSSPLSSQIQSEFLWLVGSK